MIERHRLVVIPTDFSEGAARAFERALRLPLAPDAKLVLLHVLPGPLPESLRAEAEATARASLANIVAAAVAPPGVEIVVETAIGDPFAQIIAA